MVCHIFYNIFSIIICQICYAPSPKKPSKLRFLRWNHLSIISQLAYLEQKTLVRAYLLTGYLITIALHFFLQKPSQPFFSWCCLGISDIASANCVCMFVNCHLNENAMLLWTDDCQLMGRDIRIVFCSKYASWLMIDRWCHLKNLSVGTV